jgi:hypothetical protein
MTSQLFQGHQKQQTDTINSSPVFAFFSKIIRFYFIGVFPDFLDTLYKTIFILSNLTPETTEISSIYCNFPGASTISTKPILQLHISTQNLFDDRCVFYVESIKYTPRHYCLRCRQANSTDVIFLDNLLASIPALL